MIKFFSNLFAAQSNARRIAALEADLKLVLDYASGKGVGTICTVAQAELLRPISAHFGRIRTYAHDELKKVAELRKPIAHLTDDALAVLRHMNDDIGHTFSTLAERTGRTAKQVSAIVRSLAADGIAKLVPLFSDEDSTMRGRGYVLTEKGVNAQRVAQAFPKP